MTKTKQINMSRLYALAMTRPHARFGFKGPIGRQIPQGIVAWSLVSCVVWLALAGLYVTQVTQAAPRSDRLQTLERQVEQLQRDINEQEDAVARSESLQKMTNRAQELGLVPMDKPQFVSPAAYAYARR